MPSGRRATYAALKKLVAEGKIEHDESVCLIIGGNGLKDTDSALKAVKTADVIPANMNAVREELKKKGLI